MSYASPWTAEQEIDLVDFVATGLSYRDSAGKINEKYGTHFSRNAAIGKARRLHIEAPERIKTPRKPREYKPRPGRYKPRQFTEAIPVPVCEEIGSRHILLHELTDSTCHWPYGENAPFTFCGQAPVKCGETFEPYCGWHMRISTRSGS